MRMVGVGVGVCARALIRREKNFGRCAGEKGVRLGGVTGVLVGELREKAKERRILRNKVIRR
jgi:hypothetical protein